MERWKWHCSNGIATKVIRLQFSWKCLVHYQAEYAENLSKSIPSRCAREIQQRMNQILNCLRPRRMSNKNSPTNNNMMNCCSLKNFRFCQLEQILCINHFSLLFFLLVLPLFTFALIFLHGSIFSHSWTPLCLALTFLTNYERIEKEFHCNLIHLTLLLSFRKNTQFNKRTLINQTRHDHDICSFANNIELNLRKDAV